MCGKARKQEIGSLIRIERGGTSREFDESLVTESFPLTSSWLLLNYDLAILSPVLECFFTMSERKVRLR